MADISPQERARRELIRNLPPADEMAEDVLNRTVAALEKNFEAPIGDDNYRLELIGGLEHSGVPDPKDWDALYKHMTKGRTYGAKVYGTFRITDQRTGEVVKEERRLVSVVPTPVHDRSFIVGGKKRFLMHQWRRKPGVFSRWDEKGDITNEYNLDPSTSGSIRSFKVVYDRGMEGQDPSFKVHYKSSKSVDAWALAKLLGASDKDLRKAVGKEVADGIISSMDDEKYEKNIRSFHQKVFGNKKDAKELDLNLLEAQLKDEFNRTSVDPDVMKMSLGKAEDRITQSTIVSGFGRLVDIANGGPQDDRESLVVKNILSPADLVAEAVGRKSTVDKYRSKVRRKIMGLQSDQEPKLDLLLGTDLRGNITKRITTSDVMRSDHATTPLDSFAQATSTTIMGEGAIGSEQAIPTEAKLLNSGSFGFLDPSHTPESSRAGVVLHLPVRAKIVQSQDPRRDKDLPVSKVVSEFVRPNGKKVDLSPADVSGKAIGMADQYELTSSGKIKATPNDAGFVKALRDGEVVLVKPREVDYWVQDAAQMFDVNSSLIPFANSIQGGRVGYSDKQTQQSLPLKYRETPLVQVKAPGTDYSYEQLLGEEAGAVHAPFDGEVVAIDEGDNSRTIKVRKKGGKKVEEIKLPKNIPLGGGVPLDASPTVAVGDKFKAGDVLADSVYTKDGTLSMGVNLRTVYLPHYSATFEDSILMSESAARKMTSEHMYEEELDSQAVKPSKANYLQYSPTPISKEDSALLTDEGVIKVGSRVKPGQLLLVGTKTEHVDQESAAKAAAEIGFYQSNNKRKVRRGTRFYEKRWKHDSEGVVTGVEKTRNGYKIFVKTEEPLEVGDKIFGRHGNKGVVGTILPDEMMPTDTDGKPAELVLNPLGVPGRINPSQNFETFVGKVAEKLGRPEILDNWKKESNWDFVKNKLQQYSIPDGEDFTDPTTGRKLKGISAGTQYVLKAKQQVEHKSSARGIGGFQTSGLASKGEDGAQSLGELGFYGLLAQDAREFLRDAQLNKSENRPEIWSALSNGRALPGAKVPQAFERFQAYMRGAGIEVERDSKRGVFKLLPITDDKVREIARTSGKDNVITKPWETIRAKNDKPIPGGLFDPDAVRGLSGSKWARFELDHPVPNPVYEKSIREILGIKPKEYEGLMSGTQSVATADGELYGHQAIKHMLDNVDLDVAYEKAKKAAATSKEASDRSRGYRVMKSIDMLRGNDMSPADAFMRRQVLVLPANIRGLRRDQNSGDWVIGDLNYLYRDLGMINRELVKAREIGQPPKVIAQLEAGLYEGMKSLMQSEGSVPLSGTGYQGVLGTLAGRRPDPSGKDATNVKESLFKKTLLQRRQIMSGRTVLAPDSDIDMDEVILPRKMAVAIMEPLIEAEWNRRNPPSSGGTRRNNKLRSFRERLESYKLENKRDQEVDRILENVIRDRWVAVKRDPVLHKYGVQGFKPVLRDTKTVGLHPVVYGGLNADNDGDTLAIFAPISKKASNELRDKLRPTKNLFNPASGQLEYTVSHEAILGISRATKSQGKDTGKSFNSLQAATNAYNDNQFDVNDVIDVNGRKVSYGLHLLDEALPDGHKMEDLVQKGVLPAMTDPAGLTKKQINGVLTHIAKEAPQSFSSTAAGFREVGQNVATTSGATLLLDDLKPVLVDERRRVENELYRELGKVKGIVDSGERQERTRQIFKDKLIGITDKAMTELRKTMTDKRPNMTAELTFTGARVKPGQLQQVLFAPGALTDAKDQVVESPVMQSYTEGLDMANYWASMHGARMGTVSKVVQVQEPGYLTKQLVNTSMDQSITEVDCGTTRGVEVDLSASTDDLYGRVLAAPVKVAGMNLSPGESLTPQIVSEINRKTSAKNPKVRVRSPLYCEAKEGICQVCAGRTPTGEFHAKGTNFGIIAAQSVGERSTQLMLSLFHGGGVYDPKADTEGKTSVKDMYHQASALMRMPRTMGGKAAVVAPVSGKIEKVETDTRRGGYNLQLEGAKSVFLPAERRAPNGKKFRDFYKPGDSIKAGDVLTDGIANPKAILETTGDMDKAREYLVNRMNSLYSGTGVLRRNIEALVRGVSNTVEVVGSGKTDYLPGQRISLQEAEAAKKEDPSFRFTNILKGVDVAPREVREDFMARLNYNNLRRTIIDSAAVGAESRYHGTHPIPALAYAAEFNRDGRYGAVRSDGRY